MHGNLGRYVSLGQGFGPCQWHSGNHSTKVGPDPFSGKGEAFGVNMDMMEEMDQTMLPQGITQGEVDQLYDCAADVMALPGRYYKGMMRASTYGTIPKDRTSSPDQRSGWPVCSF